MYILMALGNLLDAWVHLLIRLRALDAEPRLTIIEFDLIQPLQDPRFWYAGAYVRLFCCFKIDYSLHFICMVVSLGLCNLNKCYSARSFLINEFALLTLLRPCMMLHSVLLC